MLHNLKTDAFDWVPNTILKLSYLCPKFYNYLSKFNSINFKK